MSLEEKENLSLEKNINSYLKSLGIKTKTDPYDKKYIFKEYINYHLMKVINKKMQLILLATNA